MPIAHERINIAIDGPAGSGKSTVAKIVASRLGYVYIDTGAMYRAVAWKCLSVGITADQAEQTGELLDRISIELVPVENGQMVLVDGEDVTKQIRSGEISKQASAFAQLAVVRTVLADKQKRIAQKRGIVMDGRDIGTCVIPDAELKIFLTASVETRAMRRFGEIGEHDLGITLEALERDIVERDRMDREREISPLRQAEDAIVIDSSDMSVDEVAELIFHYSKERLDG